MLTSVYDKERKILLFIYVNQIILINILFNINIFMYLFPDSILSDEVQSNYIQQQKIGSDRVFDGIGMDKYDTTSTTNWLMTIVTFPTYIANLFASMDLYSFIAFGILAFVFGLYLIHIISIIYG